MNDISLPNFSENSKFFQPIKTPLLPKEYFNGKIAFITGGGTGLGKSMATTLSRLGAKVFITSRKENVLKKTAEEIISETGNKVAHFPCDIRNVEQIEKSLDECVKQLGDLPSLIVNNAAGNFITPSERLTPNGVKVIIDIVLLGSINVTLTIGKRLIKERKSASFVSILATYANIGSGFVMPSACAKAGVLNMTKSLSVEWSRYGIRLNAISPGPIFTEGAFSRLDPTGQFTEHVKERLPCGRLGEPEELSNLVCYLLSDYSNWMTGENIRIDGGETTNLSGEFNFLYALNNEQWDMIFNIAGKL